RLREAVGLAVDDEVDAPLPVEEHVLRAVAGDRGEAELLEKPAEKLGIWRGVFDELESVGPHRVVGGGFVACVVHGDSIARCGPDSTPFGHSYPLTNSSTTRRVRALFFSILETRKRPISRVFATCVPPHGCRSTPSISRSRMRPTPRGGFTDIVRTRSGFASSSSSVIHTVRTSWASPTSRESSRSRC